MRVLAVLCFFLLQSFQVHSTDIYLQLQRGDKAAVGLPDFSSKTDENAELSKQLREVVKDDILFSKVFNIAEDGPAVGDGKIDFKGWNDKGADILVTANISKKEDKGKVKVQMIASVFELPDGNPVFQKSYATVPDNSRQIAHAFAADFLYRFTGNRGVSQTKIAFANNMSGAKELYVVDYDGKNVRKLTSDKSVALLPRWSPDGNSILYTSFARNNPDTFIFAFDKGKSRSFSGRPGLNTPAAFAPDGQSVVVTLSCGGFPNLYLLDSGGKVLRRLTNTKAADTSASFSPDGRKIIFTSDRPGWPQIYTMDADGSNLKRLTTSGYCDSPAWSPAGDKVAYSRRTAETGHHDIVLIDMATGNAIQITKDMGNNEDPSFSPDGKYLVFTSTRDKKRELYISSLDGTMQKKLADTLGQCFTPAWGPN